MLLFLWQQAATLPWHMPSFRPDLQMLLQNWSLCRLLSTGCQRERSLQTCLPNTYPTGSQTGTHEIGGTRRALLHPSRGGHTVLELLHPLKRVIPYHWRPYSCNTLLSCYFSSISWAKILPSKTVIPPYDSPPTRPIGSTYPPSQ